MILPRSPLFLPRFTLHTASLPPSSARFCLGSSPTKGLGGSHPLRRHGTRTIRVPYFSWRCSGARIGALLVGGNVLNWSAGGRREKEFLVSLCCGRTGACQEMSCLGWFKRRSKGRRGAAASGPATAASAVTTSRSDDSGASRPVSKSTGSASSQPSISSLYEERGHGQLRAFEYEELQSATNGFSRAQKLGEGGFGSVYKGFVRPPDGKGERLAVAVKCLNQRGLQGHKQWLAEVQFLGVLEHPNLVKLLGYCAVDGERELQRLLVYDYMANKSLEDHLFSRVYPPLSWNRRLQIILGAAEGLAYLHEGLEVQVIYRDFKASNILLDKDFKAKLSDFGLAREGPTEGNTHVSTAVVGTHGYAAPDYIETGHLTVKSDVWSFGVVLYEILTGRRTLDRNRPQGEQKLLEWVSQFSPDSRNFRMIMDPKLRGEYSLKAAREIAKLAESCLLKNAKERPTMNEVVEVLRRAVQVQAEPAGGNRARGAGAAKGKRVDVAAPSRN